MSSVYKNFSKKDIVSSKNTINEAIPITGTIASGTYNDENVKTYSHGMFQTLYDYPYLSSSANRVCDITLGYSANSDLSSSTNVQNEKKINIYNQMAQVLVGHDITGSILEFDQDGDIVAGGTKLREVFFLNLNRLLVKDEIKKGSVDFKIAVGGSITGSLSGALSFTDSGAASDFRVNSPAGEYGFLSASNGYVEGNVGLVFYQAGVAVITASVLNITGDQTYTTQDFGTFLSSSDVDAVLTGSDIDHFADSLRARWSDLDFNNTIDINSRFYNCRLDSNEFNYSANPTYLTGSRIRVKEVSQDEPLSYVTTIGLYAPDGVLMAVAKLSEPLRKSVSTPINLRVRLDF